MARGPSPSDRPSRRRFMCDILALASLGMLSACGVVPPQAQPPAQVRRIGVLTVYLASGGLPQPLRQGLEELGYIDGQNVVIDIRGADFASERLPELAAELVQMQCDVIVARGTAETLAAKQATTTIPIVMITPTDPVGSGLVASLARPGGNVTGSAVLTRQLGPKRLQLLKEAAPGIARVAVFWDSTNPGMLAGWPELEAMGRTLNVQLESLPVRDPTGLALPPPTSAHQVDAVLMFGGPFLGGESKMIEDFAASHRLPGMFALQPSVVAGGLMAYSPFVAPLERRAAEYVHKILKGTKPADLPVVQAETFYFVINLKTARDLGLTIPPSVLNQVTEIIE